MRPADSVFTAYLAYGESSQLVLTKSLSWTNMIWREHLPTRGAIPCDGYVVLIEGHAILGACA